MSGHSLTHYIEQGIFNNQKTNYMPQVTFQVMTRFIASKNWNLHEKSIYKNIELSSSYNYTKAPKRVVIILHNGFKIHLYPSCEIKAHVILKWIEDHLTFPNYK